MNLRALPERAGIRLPADLWAKIRGAYAEPGRAYHNLKHVQEVLTRFDEVQHAIGWTHPAEVFLALLFHDVVYVAGAHDNEERSAQLARSGLSQAGLDAFDLAYVERLIRLTANHGKLKQSEVSEEEALFLDCDMAILGADQAAFSDYEAGIRAEYSSMPAELFEAGRRTFVERLLASDAIFLSRYFNVQLEAKARQNLKRVGQPELPQRESFKPPSVETK